MNQSLLLNDDLVFIDTLSVWALTGFADGQSIRVLIRECNLPKDTKVTSGLMFDIEDCLAQYLEEGECDEQGEIWLNENFSR